MRKLDLFILKSFFGPFVMTFFITVFILVMQFLWLYIDELVGKGLGFWVIMEFMGWGAATVLPLSMPLATLLASIMTFGNLGENNELLSMKAAGISLQRILYPLIYVAVIISISAFFVSNNLIPIAWNKIFTLQYDIGRTKEEIKIPTGIFYNGIEGYSLRVSSNNKETGMMYDVMVYNHTANKGNVSVAIADSGMIKSTPGKDALIFTLYNGVSYDETNKAVYRDTSYALQQIEFTMQEMVIPLENYSFQKSESDRYGSDIRACNLNRLRHDKDSITVLFDSTAASHREKVTYSLAMDKAVQLDTAKNKGIKTNFAFDSLYRDISSEAELEAVSGAISAVKKAVQSMQGFEHEVYQHTFYLRRIDLELLRKFTLSFACFIFFFIGASLGAIIRKGGLGTPVIISSLFFVLYWVVDITGIKLARDGVISPQIGAVLSTLVLLPIGVFLTWKSTKDSSIFNIETYFMPIIKFFKKVAGGRKTGARPKVVFMGTPEFAVESLKALVENGYDIAGVVTVPDRKSGRGQKISFSPVKQYLLSLSPDGETAPVPLLQPESLKDPEFIERLKELDADVFVVVAFRMLPKSVWSIPKLGTFNLHASLLPKYRGAAPINWAIINGEKKSGVTTFLLDEKIDTGAILFREEMDISPDESVGDLYERLMKCGAVLVCKTIDALADRKVKPCRQGDTSDIPDQCRYAPKLTSQTGVIEWSRSGQEIHNLVRGLSPRPGAHSTLCCGEERQTVKIYATRPVPAEALSEVIPIGAVSVSDGVLLVGCGDGAVSILELQMPGKKRLHVSEFLKGWRGENGYFE